LFLIDGKEQSKILETEKKRGIKEGKQTSGRKKEKGI
jgi:hypothetical protein